MILDPGDHRWPITLKGKGENGYYFYEFSRGSCHLRVTRQHTGAFEQRSYFNDWMPGRAFPSFAAMETAAAEITEEQAAAAVAPYPSLRDVAVLDEADALGCFCCPRTARKPATVQVTVATNWVLAHDRLGMLCEEHEYLMADPPALLEALKANDLAERNYRLENE